MNEYQYQETININVSVFAHSKHDAQDKVASAIAIALSKMPPLDQIDQDIRDNSFDTINIQVTE
jgi:hypothetical protein